MRKKFKTKSGRDCNACGKSFYFSTPTAGIASIQTMIDHYKTKHPDRMAKCFDDYGQTWNAQYDVVMKAFHATNTKLTQAISERDTAAAQQRTLAAKLNAIILILENKS